jgi:hypothetical protein
MSVVLSDMSYCFVGHTVEALVGVPRSTGFSLRIPLEPVLLRNIFHAIKGLQMRFFLI